MRWTGLICYILLPWCSVLPQAQINRATQSRTEISKTRNQNKPFLLISWWSQVFCHCNEKLTNTDAYIPYVYIFKIISQTNACSIKYILFSHHEKHKLLSWKPRFQFGILYLLGELGCGRMVESCSGSLTVLLALSLGLWGTSCTCVSIL